ncbi:B-box zinc finger protein 24 [Canna indica]|uniref:B-box zinc finger protein 24 n=1 Tax=Canna indica TaxID=4628 RepID=A0AAQ3Q6L5_9LILI|nr:B-box zinc finger protein 24 [Canna indica]
MKIQCDVCEKAPAAVICCADEAALCGSCDVEIHAANKLASKHQRLQLQCLPSKLPRCDICQEKAAFIFCVEDRALFCKDCDEPIHVAGTLSGEHQRYLATGVHIALSKFSDKEAEKNNPEPPSQSPTIATAPKVSSAQQVPPFLHSPWAVDDFLQLSDYESTYKKESPVGFGELDCFADIDIFGEQVPKRSLTAAEVPELSNSPGYFKTNKASVAFKKPRFEVSDEDEFFTVPDLG